MTDLSNERIADMRETTQMIGDRWSLLIIWACLNGTTRFEEFHRRLGIARNILSDRLGRLQDLELVERRPVFRGARRMEYVPKARARQLRPVVRALIDWRLSRLSPHRSAIAEKRRAREATGTMTAAD